MILPGSYCCVPSLLLPWFRICQDAAPVCMKVTAPRRAPRDGLWHQLRSYLADVSYTLELRSHQVLATCQSVICNHCARRTVLGPVSPVSRGITYRLCVEVNRWMLSTHLLCRQHWLQPSVCSFDAAEKDRQLGSTPWAWCWCRHSSGSAAKSWCALRLAGCRAAQRHDWPHTGPRPSTEVPAAKMPARLASLCAVDVGMYACMIAPTVTICRS